MKLSETLREISNHVFGSAYSDQLRECADKAEDLEQGVYEDVRDFHRKFGHPAPRYPVLDILLEIHSSTMDFRIKLIREECDELIEAIENRNPAAIAAEACDVIYVVLGTLVSLGLPFLPFWRDVQRANMAKEVNPTGGKPIKPAGWEKPNPREVLLRYRQGLK